MPLENHLSIYHNGFHVRKLPPQPVLVERHPYILGGSNIISWFLALLYLITQLNFTFIALSDYFQTTWRVWAVLICEFCLNFQDLVLGANLVSILFCKSKTQVRARYFLVGNTAPTIDVFITCCGEQVDVILDTVAAALAQDYPPERFRVFLLDDGHDKDLHDSILSLNKNSAVNNRPELRYLARNIKKGMKSYFKAGNLQFGIEKTKALGGSDFIASLDADMIPEPDWLRRIIPHLILGEDIALACPPQCYYNVPHSDPLGQKAELALFFSIYEPLNDRLDAAMCTGSGYIARRNALEDIEGWPQVEAGEDYMCSAKLSNNGWKVAFIREDVQFGLAPESLKSHIKQRMRWVDSGLEVHKQFCFYLPGNKITFQMTWAQRGLGIVQVLREYAAFTNIVALLILPLALFPTNSDVFEEILEKNDPRFLYNVFAASFIAYRVNTYLMHSNVGIRQVWNFQSTDMWCAPFIAYRCLFSIFPKLFGALSFESSGSIISVTNERSRYFRKPFLYRLSSPYILLWLSHCIYVSIPLIFLVLRHSRSEYIFVFPSVMIKLVDIISKVSVPLWYMAFPPTVPERKDLMLVDGKGVRRPKKEPLKDSGFGIGWILMMDCFGLWVLFHHV